MEKDETSRATKKENKAWEMAYKARMRQIIPGLFLGNVEASHNPDMLQENHINAIVSLTDARWIWWNSNTRRVGIPANRHKWVQCVDSSTQDLLAYMSDICDFIYQMACPILSLSSSLVVEYKQELKDKEIDTPSEAILIHCDLGISRSPTIIIAYIMRKYGIKREDALKFVHSKQRVKPSANFTRQLQIWEEVGYEVWDNEERTVAKAPYQEYLNERAVLLEKKRLTGNEPLAPLNL